MTYTKTTWANTPATTSPINSTNLNKIENGIYDNTTNITNLQNVTKYITATAGSDGDFKINIANTLTTGDVYYITFPTATTSTSNARLSIDGGTTYYNVIRASNSANVLVKYIAQQYAEIYFNGTAFVFKDNISKELYSNASGTQGNVTISEDITNFNYVEVIFGNTANALLNTGKIPVGNTLALFYSNYEFESPNYYATYKSENVSITGTTLSRAEVYRGRIQIDSNASSATASTTIRPYITKVIGYR